MMHRCQACRTKITTFREHHPSKKGNWGWHWPDRPATWIHLEEGHDDHVPAPPNQDPVTGMPRKARKAKAAQEAMI